MYYQLKCSIVTSKGDRDINEDAVGVVKKDHNMCFVVCDGLGGHGRGDIASNLVVDVFKDQFNKTDEMVNFLGSTFSAAQDVLMAEQKIQNATRQMKTTAAAIATDEKFAYIGHIGDSRVYIFNKNKVRDRTLDHSIPQMLALAKEIKESQIRNHSERNILLRVLGIEWEENQFELMRPIPLKKCQAFLICSDGFWELIEEKIMCEILKKSNSVEEWVSGMEDIVKANGMGKSMDNYTALGIWCTRKE